MGGHNMNSRELDKMIEQYKREMLTYSRSSRMPLQEEREEPAVSEKEASREHFEPAAQAVNEPETEQAQVIKPKEAHREAQSVPAMAQPAPARAQIVPARPHTAPSAAQIDIEQEDYAVQIGGNMTEKLKSDCAGLTQEERSGERGRSCRDLDDFLAANSATGTMSINAFAADRAYGVGNARVIVLIPLPSGNAIIYNGLTDIDGQTGAFTLPAPPKAYSLSQEGSTVIPYAGYTVLVEHPDFVRAVFTNVPVFAGIESIQPVQMLSKVADMNEPSPIAVQVTEPELN